jgi:hypothetical protein
MASSAEYYRKNAKARKKKAATDKKINARPAQKKKRAEANAKVRARKKAGKSTKGLDYDHATNKFVKTATNRGRKGEGGRKKKR